MLLSKKVVIPAAVLAVAAAGLGEFALGRASAAAPQLVYICSAQPCTNAQEFEVFDAAGNPIYSVGEFGGDAVFGDNRSVFGPGSVFNPAVVESYTDPASYDRAHGLATSCVAPVAWLEPHGLWHCAGTKWVKVVSL